MSTTEQRTGFRLPWGGDTHRAEGDPSSSSDEQAGAPADAADAADAPADAVDAPVNAGEAPDAPETTDTAGHAAGWPSTDAAEPPAADAVAADAVAAAPPPAPAARVSKSSATPIPPKPRRENPLVAGLVKAMREAAETARSETSSRVAAAATAQVETIHASSAEEAEALKRRADEEIAGIRDWSKAEMARIREETDRRISRRREDLGEEIDAHAASVERRIDAVRAAVGEFETRMGAFFEKLMQEDDPAMLATLAEQMPEPPELDEIVASAPSAPTTTLDEADAAAAEAEALALLDADAEAGDGSDEDPGDGELIEEATVAERLAMLTTPPHGETEAAADTTTRVTVVGLISVASISVFKRSLGKLTDVRSVSVSSGPDGDFIFAVAHGPATDLRTAIPGISGFEARISGESEDGLIVVARDPEA